jgi:hypothetical protein
VINQAAEHREYRLLHPFSHYLASLTGKKSKGNAKFFLNEDFALN